MIDPPQTFIYQFEVRDSGFPPQQWNGGGSGRPTFKNVEGLSGPKPRFELSSGWLTLFPTDGWARSFPIRAFSDLARPHKMDENARVADLKAHGDKFLEAQQEALKEAAEKVSPKENFDAYMKEQNVARARALRRRGLTRDFSSFSLFVGDSLSIALRTGDELKLTQTEGDATYDRKP
jgi:hypothetical protein